MKERPTTYTHRGERFHIAALIALFLLALEWFVGDRRRVAAAALALAVGLGFTAAPVHGSSAGDAVSLYNDGDYLGALARFREALEKDPSAPLYYDIGNSLYRLDKFEEAARHYAGALSEADSTLRRNARYNTGNCLFNAGDLQGAVEEYKEALKLDPNDEDAKHNLELANRMLQESQSQGGQGGGEQKQEGDESQESREEGQEQPEGGQEQDQSQRGDQGEGQSAEQGQRDEGTLGEESEAGRFSKEEAERLLEALAGDEKDLLSKRLKSKVRRKGVKKNW
jgi:tetratricopeptide (TPR) repeat protein